MPEKVQRTRIETVATYWEHHRGGPIAADALLSSTRVMLEPKVWGDTRELYRALGLVGAPAHAIGEAFLISALSGELEASVINESGRNLRELFADNTLRIPIFGTECKTLGQFPLLLKALSAKERLSLQVHPRGPFGKSEAWYALSDAKIICGFAPGMDREKFQELIDSGFFETERDPSELAQYFNVVDLAKGDAVAVPAGTVHAVLSGVFLEPQQPNNTTYRIYDWGRVGRGLHLEQALREIDFEAPVPKIVRAQEYASSGKLIIPLVATEYFAADLWMIPEGQNLLVNHGRSKFLALFVVAGEGIVVGRNNALVIEKGQPIIIPAQFNDFRVKASKGSLEILCSYVPDGYGWAMEGIGPR